MLFCEPLEEGWPNSSGHHFSPPDIGFMGSIGFIGFIGSICEVSLRCFSRQQHLMTRFRHVLKGSVFMASTHAYGLMTRLNLSKSCEEEVVSQLVELQRRAADYARRGGPISEKGGMQ
jgi:hypothetical protein